MCGGMMDKKTRLTADEFHIEIRPRLFGVSEKVVALAELCFVQGVSIKDAGERLGMSKQSASQNIKRVLAAINNVPKDWVYFEGYIPPTLASEIRLKISTLLQDSKKNPLK